MTPFHEVLRIAAHNHLSTGGEPDYPSCTRDEDGNVQFPYSCLAVKEALVAVLGWGARGGTRWLDRWFDVDAGVGRCVPPWWTRAEEPTVIQAERFAWLMFLADLVESGEIWEPVEYQAFARMLEAA